MPLTDLCAWAGVGRQTYIDARAGVSTPTPSTLIRLQTALKRYHVGFGGEAGAVAPYAACKAAIVLAALYLDEEPRAALNVPHDPTGSTAAARETARTRHLGMWIANQILGFRVADVARAFGSTKQNVSTAISKVNNDEGFADIRAKIEGVFS